MMIYLIEKLIVSKYNLNKEKNRMFVHNVKSNNNKKKLEQEINYLCSFSNYANNLFPVFVFV